jgi:hypothetical protein
VKHLVAATIALKGIGGILFIFGSSLGAYLLVRISAMLLGLLSISYGYNGSGALESSASA